MFFLIALIAVFHGTARCQDNVFELAKSDSRLADEYFAAGNYEKAIELYWTIYRKNNDAASTKLKIARSYYYLREYNKAAGVFDAIARGSSPMKANDVLLHAESQVSSGDVKKAIDIYRDYLRRNSGDEVVQQKAWRLANLQYLFEDSLHYFVRPLPFNTPAAELCAVPYRDGIVFLSNRKEVTLIEKVDQANSPLFKAYFAARPDSSADGLMGYKTSFFSKAVNSKLQVGPVAFFDNGRKLVFASYETGPVSGRTKRTLQLFFAAVQEGGWEITGSFPFNDGRYSITDPSITNDGTVLYFSSDMPGGKGGKDLYRSEFLEGKWMPPVNLGDVVNTRYDECFPFINKNTTLYFASNGHAGMGALDIFKIEQHQGKWLEILNVGYPVNSRADDFALVVDSTGVHGYFSSNRKATGLDDNLYEVNIDLQTYPIHISGFIGIKSHSWSDSTEIRPFPNAKLVVIDNQRDTQVFEGGSDENGNFSVVIPYYSKFKIRVIGPDRVEHVVSMEIPKQRKEYGRHEIVIVKDSFQPGKNN
jgi:tetratricopeptide (TPR) repeat protein